MGLGATVADDDDDDGAAAGARMVKRGQRVRTPSTRLYLLLNYHHSAILQR